MLLCVCHQSIPDKDTVVSLQQNQLKDLTLDILTFTYILYVNYLNLYIYGQNKQINLSDDSGLQNSYKHIFQSMCANSAVVPFLTPHVS